jgi:LysM domain/Transglycosylase SLT domain
MQTYQHIRMCLHRYVKGSLVGKFSIGVVLGLLLLVATFFVNVPGASAHALNTCSGSDNSYRVVAGDTLSAIGYRYGKSWSALASYNHIANPNLIYVNQIVCIPVHGANSTAPAQGQVTQKSVTTNVAPQPQPAPVGNGSVAAMIYQVFGASGSAAINVARCESGLNPGAYNPSGAAGVFQIMPGTWAGTSEAGQSPYNAYANIVAAHQIFVRDGYSWREWTCQP